MEPLQHTKESLELPMLLQLEKRRLIQFRMKVLLHGKWSSLFPETLEHILSPTNCLFFVGLAGIRPHLLSVMVLVVITKVITTRPMTFDKECAGYPFDVHLRIIRDYFKVIDMGIDIIISIPSQAFP